MRDGGDERKREEKEKRGRLIRTIAESRTSKRKGKKGHPD
jgi:hypothetical protein